MDIINEWLIEIILFGVEWAINTFVDGFNASLTLMSTEAGTTPAEFSSSILAQIQEISNTAILPVASLIITYIFCYELITMMTEKNNMVQFEYSNIFSLIIKTTLAIMIVSNTFNITLAFFDVGQHLVNQVSVNTIGTLDSAGIMDALKVTIDDNVGIGIMVLLFSLVALILGLGAIGAMYLIAWTRIITIMLYISLAPIPFSTFMSRDWIGAVGQNYLKNLMALAMQGFLMMITMLVYGGLVDNVSGIIMSRGAIIGVVLLIVCMFVCVKALMSCLTLAKSIFGAH